MKFVLATLFFSFASLSAGEPLRHYYDDVIFYSDSQGEYHIIFKPNYGQESHHYIIKEMEHSPKCGCDQVVW